jgi:predicted RNA-binding Zn ribbon-like protein
MSTLPSWYPGVEAKPAPMPLLLVQGFLNTRDVEEDSDLLRDRDEARTWLVDAGLLSPGTVATDDDLAFARRFRESVRSVLGSRPGREDATRQLRAVRELTDTRHPRLTVDDRGALTLNNPRHDDLADGLFDLLLIVRSAQEEGSWSRLKACSNPDCQWVFYDRSRNQQGHWCDMAVCGNRLKNRTLRARRR